MGLDSIRHLKKGDILKASEFNTVVDHLKNNHNNVQLGGIQNIRPQTLFFTKKRIPPYSIFPLIPHLDNTDNTFYSKFVVERYNVKHQESYIRGYFGTNGRFEILPNTSFYGHIISREIDTPIIIEDYEDGKRQCGFKSGSWFATVKSAGLVIGEKASVSNDCYFVRHNEGCDIFLLELKYDVSPGIDRCGKICISSGEAWILDVDKSPGTIESSSSYSESYDDCHRLIRVSELGERVYNNSPQWYRAKDRCGNKILYFGLRDIFGTIWLDRTYGVIPDVECCSSSSSSSSISESSSFSSSSSSSESSLSSESEASESSGSEQPSEVSVSESVSENSYGGFCDYTGVVQTVKDLYVNGGKVTFNLQRMTFQDGLLCSVEDGGSETIDLCSLDCGSGSSAEESVGCVIWFYKVRVHIHQKGGEEIYWDSEKGEYIYSKPIDMDVEGWTPWSGSHENRGPFVGMGVVPGVSEHCINAYHLQDFVGALGGIDDDGKLTAYVTAVLDDKCWDNEHSGGVPPDYNGNDEDYYYGFYNNRLADGTFWAGNWYMVGANDKAVRFEYNQKGEIVVIE